MNLTSEQQEFIDCALKGQNILVDACVGSGKTTAIQNLCNAFPTTKRILYLTYNKLLKVDAKEKIKNSNVTVTNYHGFAFMMLKNAGIKSGVSDLIQNFNRYKPSVYHYDVMVLDEYQDIDLEIANMLSFVKEKNPGIQIVAVGDIKQKIYDKTTLNIMEFMEEFLGPHTDLEFTQCFRLGADHAAFLSRVWGKKITGVNNSCKVSYMKPIKVVEFLSKQNPADVMCLGSRNGKMSNVLNTLETKYKNSYNKMTVYASISDNGKSGATEPSKDTAIFTTFDSSKGLERKICVIFDFTEDFWHTRINMPQQKYEILRNIFCVAASRGKEEIIFVVPEETYSLSDQKTNSYGILTEQTLSTPVHTKVKFDNVQMSTMFDFKYKEDVEECFHLLETKKIEKLNTEPINIKTSDCMIDLAPCVGIYQEASYFKNYDLKEDLKMFRQTHQDVSVDIDKYKKLDKQILYLISLETSQKRYIRQVDEDIATKEDTQKLHERLSEVFTPEEYEIQQECEVQFCDGLGKYIFTAAGFSDVVKDDNVYELKFVSELQHEHFLQCAMYMFALKKEKGYLWNTRINEMYEITIPNRRKFMDAVIKTVTKHQVMQYKAPVVREEWKKVYHDEEEIY